MGSGERPLRFIAELYSGRCLIERWFLTHSLFARSGWTYNKFPYWKFCG